ncbi:MAG: hypothetical protein EBZ85_03420 [Actinobacteria bacterium]|nr:hypothetical protein [Actinomycetota bacterium]
MKTRGYAALRAKEDLVPFEFDRREMRDTDVVIDIAYAGICHSDIHQAREEWGEALFPMVPGHEIVGTVLDGDEAPTFQCRMGEYRVIPAHNKGAIPFISREEGIEIA